MILTVKFYKLMNLLMKASVCVVAVTLNKAALKS